MPGPVARGKNVRKRSVTFSEADPEIRTFAVTAQPDGDTSDSEFEEEQMYGSREQVRPLWEMIGEKGSGSESRSTFDPGPRPLWEMLPATVLPAPSKVCSAKVSPPAGASSFHPPLPSLRYALNGGTDMQWDDERMRQWLDPRSWARLARTSRAALRCSVDAEGRLLLPHVVVPDAEMWPAVLSRVHCAALLSVRGACPSCEDAAGCVLTALRGSSRLECLDWCGPMPSPDVPRLHFSPFLSGVGSQLRSLRLVGFELGGPRAGCRYLTRALRGASHLLDFDLSRNGIDGTSAIHIADLLARGVPARTLVLDGNPIGEAGAERLSLGLQCIVNPSLQKLLLRGCGIAPKCAGASALQSSAASIQIDIGVNYSRMGPASVTTPCRGFDH